MTTASPPPPAMPTPDRMDLFERNHIVVRGAGTTTMIFAHGYGCDQNMWRLVAPAFEDRYRVVTYDHVGAGRSDLAAFDRARHATLDGYADDLVEICRALGIEHGIFVGHSVACMIGVVATCREPAMFDRLVLVGPSARYIDDGDYRGGFTQAQIDEMLAFLDANHMGWSAAMAPVIMGNSDRPALADELTNSFCRTDPEIAKHFARTTFLSDNRADLPRVAARTLILQCADDVIAPEYVGEYVHAQLPNSMLVRMAATGHCPNLSAPAETIAAIDAFLADASP